VARDLRTTEQKVHSNLKLRLCEIIKSAAASQSQLHCQETKTNKCNKRNDITDIGHSHSDEEEEKQPLRLVATVCQEATSPNESRKAANLRYTPQKLRKIFGKWCFHI